MDVNSEKSPIFLLKHNNYVKKIDPQTPLWKLTVKEFLEVSKHLASESRYAYGLKGLAQLLGVSISKASEIKSSGILDNAIIQKGKIIIIDKKKAIELFAKS